MPANPSVPDLLQVARKVQDAQAKVASAMKAVSAELAAAPPPPAAEGSPA